MSRREHRDIVLVVDDSPDTLRMLTDALEQAGMTVLIARDGDQALAMIERIIPDVVLMDAIMPGRDGFDTCRQLKRKKMLTHVPVIFMTGLSDTDDIVKGLEAGGVDYVTKPIIPDELLARIRVHLANARMAHSAKTALDAFGRFLLATNRAGHVLWCTPQAVKLLSGAFKGFDSETFVFSQEVREWLRQRTSGEASVSAEIVKLELDQAGGHLELSYIGQIGSDEILFRLVEGNGANDQTVLRNKLMLTHRESEVLLWIAKGKSNRDIADILTLSPRTVNKHLEQIYAKLGVENRTSAAALAVRALGLR